MFNRVGPNKQDVFKVTDFDSPTHTRWKECDSSCKFDQSDFKPLFSRKPIHERAIACDHNQHRSDFILLEKLFSLEVAKVRHILQGWEPENTVLNKVAQRAFDNDLISYQQHKKFLETAEYDDKVQALFRCVQSADNNKVNVFFQLLIDEQESDDTFKGLFHKAREYFQLTGQCSNRNVTEVARRVKRKIEQPLEMNKKTRYDRTDSETSVTKIEIKLDDYADDSDGFKRLLYDLLKNPLSRLSNEKNISEMLVQLSGIIKKSDITFFQMASLFRENKMCPTWMTRLSDSLHGISDRLSNEPVPKMHCVLSHAFLYHYITSPGAGAYNSACSEVSSICDHDIVEVMKGELEWYQNVAGEILEGPFSRADKRLTGSEYTYIFGKKCDGGLLPFKLLNCVEQEQLQQFGFDDYRMQKLTVHENCGRLLYGEGSYGSVKFAMIPGDLSDSYKIVPVKKIKGSLDNCIEEFDLQNKASYDGVAVPVYGVSETRSTSGGKCFMAVMGEVPGVIGSDLLYGDLDNSPKLISEGDKKKFTRSLFKAYQSLYKSGKGIKHGDIKPDNIYITDNLDVGFLDFGLATEQAYKVSGKTNIFSYCPPEMLKDEPYDTEKADMFMLGFALLEFGAVLRKNININQNEYRVKVAKDKLKASWDREYGEVSQMIEWDIGGIINQCKGKFFTETLESLVSRMLDIDPGKRPSFKEAMREIEGWVGLKALN